MGDVKFNIRNDVLKPEELMSDAEREKIQFEKNKMKFRHSPYPSMGDGDFTGDFIRTVNPNLKQRFASVDLNTIGSDVNKNNPSKDSDDVFAK